MFSSLGTCLPASAWVAVLGSDPAAKADSSRDVPEPGGSVPGAVLGMEGLHSGRGPLVPGLVTSAEPLKGEQTQSLLSASPMWVGPALGARGDKQAGGVGAPAVAAATW